MKVKDLITVLKNCNPEHEVILSSYREGNRFSPAVDYSVLMYEAENTYSGSVLSEDDFEEDPKYYKENCIVLWPAN